MTFHQILAVLLLILGLTTLQGCGQRICVAGIGDCAVVTRGKDTQSTAAKVSIKAASRDVKINETLELTVSGGDPGTKGYTWTLVGGGSISQGSGLSIIFKAADKPTTTTIKVTDSRYKDDSDTDTWAQVALTILSK